LPPISMIRYEIGHVQIFRSSHSCIDCLRQ
jgi:hypothetical protein